MWHKLRVSRQQANSQWDPRARFFLEPALIDLPFLSICGQLVCVQESALLLVSVNGDKAVSTMSTFPPHDALTGEASRWLHNIGRGGLGIGVALIAVRSVFQHSSCYEVIQLLILVFSVLRGSNRLQRLLSPTGSCPRSTRMVCYTPAFHLGVDHGNYCPVRLVPKRYKPMQTLCSPSDMATATSRNYTDNTDLFCASHRTKSHLPMRKHIPISCSPVQKVESFLKTGSGGAVSPDNLHRSSALLIPRSIIISEDSSLHHSLYGLFERKSLLSSDTSTSWSKGCRRSLLSLKRSSM